MEWNLDPPASKTTMAHKFWKEMGSDSKDMLDRWTREGDSFIENLLNAGMDLNSYNRYGKTILSFATECGNLKMVEFLVQKDANADLANSDSTKPIHIAAQYGHKDIMKLFLNIRKISVNSRDKNKCTPLHYIAEKSDISSDGRGVYQELVHILVNCNANINAVNRDGLTPLLLAARNHKKHLVELFIKLGANLQCSDKRLWTILHHACSKGWSDIVRTLIEERFDVNLNSKTFDGYAPAILVASHTTAVISNAVKQDIVTLLVEYGADINTKDKDGRSLLDYVCNTGCLEVVKILVNKKCDMNTKDSKGKTPMMTAALMSHLNIVEHLIESGADVKCFDKSGSNVLHLACSNGWYGVVKSLLRKGCDPVVKGPYGTPLLMAAQYSNVVKYLVECGADINDKDEDGCSALHIACQNGSLEAVKFLVAKGCDPNAKVKNGNTPLMLSLLNGNRARSVAEYLLAIGVDVNSCRDHGWTALHLACDSGFLVVVKSLLRKGAHVNVQSGIKCETPLHTAIGSSYHSNMEIIKELLIAGADCNAVNRQGKTAFNLFVQKFKFVESLEVIILFIERGAYFLPNDYSIVFRNRGLRKGIFQNTRLCMLALLNLFNNVELPKIYNIPYCSERLPRIENLTIVSKSIANDYAKSAKFEIQTKEYCNLIKVRTPTVLRRSCVLSLLKHFNNS